MKTVLLFRHAKADPGNRDRDPERDLVPRGEKDAERVGKALARAEQVPDLAIASTAVRAQRTLALAAAAGDWKSQIRLEAALYGATSRRLTALLRELDDTVDSVCLVGHEPALSSFAALLLGRLQIHLATAACMRIDLDVESWTDLRPRRGELRW